MKAFPNVMRRSPFSKKTFHLAVFHIKLIKKGYSSVDLGVSCIIITKRQT